MDDHIFPSAEKFVELVVDGLKEFLPAMLIPALRQALEKPYMTKRELSDLTGWSDRKISYMKANRTIPFIRRGRTILFPTDDIYAFLEEGRVDAKSSS